MNLKFPILFATILMVASIYAGPSSLAGRLQSKNKKIKVTEKEYSDLGKEYEALAGTYEQMGNDKDLIEALEALEDSVKAYVKAVEEEVDAGEKNQFLLKIEEVKTRVNQLALKLENKTKEDHKRILDQAVGQLPARYSTLTADQMAGLNENKMQEILRLCNKDKLAESLHGLHKIRFIHGRIFNNRWNINLHTQGDSGKETRDQLEADHSKAMEEMFKKNDQFRILNQLYEKSLQKESLTTQYKKAFEIKGPVPVGLEGEVGRLHEQAKKMDLLGRAELYKSMTHYHIGLADKEVNKNLNIEYAVTMAEKSLEAYRDYDQVHDNDMYRMEIDQLEEEIVRWRGRIKDKKKESEKAVGKVV